MASNGNASSRNAARPRPAVTNPHLKKKAQTTTTAAAVKPKPNNASGVNITRVQVIKAKLLVKAADPNATAGIKNGRTVTVTNGSAVTPHKTSSTKKLASTKHGRSSSESSRRIDNPHRSKIKVTPTPKKTIQKPTANFKPAPSTIPPSSKTVPKPTVGSKPTTLKSRLKSQIAALKLQKKERQYEKRRAAEEEERVRLLRVKEEQRREREETTQKEEPV